MSATQAKRAVILAMLVAGVTTTATSLIRDGGLPSVQVPIGVFFVGASLALAAEAAPGLAGGMAVLIIVSTILSGGALWTATAAIFDR